VRGGDRGGLLGCARESLIGSQAVVDVSAGLLRPDVELLAGLEICLRLLQDSRCQARGRCHCGAGECPASLQLAQGGANQMRLTCSYQFSSVAGVSWCVFRLFIIFAGSFGGWRLVSEGFLTASRGGFRSLLMSLSQVTSRHHHDSTQFRHAALQIRWMSIGDTIDRTRWLFSTVDRMQ
jgi:hypothetical protein